MVLLYLRLRTLHRLHHHRETPPIPTSEHLRPTRGTLSRRPPYTDPLRRLLRLRLRLHRPAPHHFRGMWFTPVTTIRPSPLPTRTPLRCHLLHLKPPLSWKPHRMRTHQPGGTHLPNPNHWPLVLLRLMQSSLNFNQSPGRRRHVGNLWTATTEIIWLTSRPLIRRWRLPPCSRRQWLRRSMTSVTRWTHSPSVCLSWNPRTLCVVLTSALRRQILRFKQQSPTFRNHPLRTPPRLPRPPALVLQ